MKKYTVILLYPEYVQEYDEPESFVAWVQQESVGCAVAQAKRVMLCAAECGEMGDPPGSDIPVVAVFEGWRRDVKE